MKKENDLKGSTFSFSHGGQISVTHVGAGGEVGEGEGTKRQHKLPFLSAFSQVSRCLAALGLNTVQLPSEE